MMSAFFHFQHTLNGLFNNCIKLYWYQISSSWNMNGVQIDLPPPPEKTTLKKPSLIRVNSLWTPDYTTFRYEYIIKYYTDIILFQYFFEREAPREQIGFCMWLLSYSAEWIMGYIFQVSHIFQLITRAFRHVK